MTEKISDTIFEIIDELATEEIKSLVEQLKSEQELRDYAEKIAAVAEIKAIADKAGLIVTISDVNLLKRKAGAKVGTKAKMKYRNPVTGEEWSGRGLKPKWVIDFISEGKDMQDYLTDAFKLPEI